MQINCKKATSDELSEVAQSEKKLFFRQTVTPLEEGIDKQMGIVKTFVARHLTTYEVGLLVGLILTTQFHLCHDQSLVVAIELVNLKDMVATFYQIATLVDDATLAQLQQMLCLVEGYLFLELITRHTAIHRLALDGKVSLVVACAHSHRSSLRRDIALLNMTIRKGGALVCVAFLDKELSLYFQSTHFLFQFSQDMIRYTMVAE